MSKYLLDKFLYTVDRDPELVERYREDPEGTVSWWEAEVANLASTLDAAPAQQPREQERLEVDTPSKPARKRNAGTTRSRAKKAS